MKNNRTVAWLVVIAIAVMMLILGGRAWGEEQHSAEQATSEGSALSMSKFYVGSVGRIGAFPGKLVCLRCDIKPGPGAMSRCAKEGHLHALSMEDDSMIHPLLAGTEEVFNQINSGELHGKDVTVHGIHYPVTGAILVDRIAPSK